MLSRCVVRSRYLEHSLYASITIGKGIKIGHEICIPGSFQWIKIGGFLANHNSET